MKHAAAGRALAGRYRLRRELGSGTHGSVHLATDLVTGAEVAVKLSAGGSSDDALRREYDVLARLRHPNLPAALDLGSDPRRGTVFLALEYIDGLPLDQVADLAPLDAVDLLAQACRAIGFLHRRGIVHGDVKPANMLVGRRPAGRWWLRVIDLGLSLRHGEGQHGVLRGTARYAAPSVLRGEPPRRRSDLYSIGACFRRVLGDEPPGDARRVEGVLRRLLAEDEDTRYQTAERAVEDVLRALPELRAREDGAFLVGAPLVGRDEEMARLERWLIAAEEARHAVPTLLVRGRDGLGKTRLLDELAHRARLRGRTVCRASCPPGPPSPFAPLRDVLHHLAVIRGDAAPRTARELRALATRLNGSIGNGPAGESDDAEAVALHVRLLRGLEAAAAGRVILVLLDDGQWLDASTAAFLRFLNGTERSASVAVGLAGEETNSLDAGWQGRAERIDLRPLTEGGSCALASSFLGEDEEAAFAARRIAASTGGDPGFTESAARAWGRARGEVEAAALEETIHAWLPASLRALHERQWEGLSADERGLAEELSVLDRCAPPALIAALSGLEGDAVPRALDSLEAAAVLVSAVAGGLAGHRFSGDALRRFVLDRLDEGRRRELHLRAARAWSDVLEDPWERSEVLVEHFLAAGRIVEGAGHGVVTARRYVSRRLHREAISLCERLLAPVAEVDIGPWEADLRECLGDAYRGTGGFRGAREAYGRAAVLREGATAASTGGSVRLLRKRGTVEISLGEFAAADGLLREALEHVDDTTEVGEHARIHEYLAHVKYRLGHVEEAKEHLRKGLAVFARPEEESDASDLWNDLGIIEFRQGRYERALEHHRCALAIRDRVADLDGQSRSLTNLANVALVTGNVAEARRNYEASLEIKRQLANAQSIAVTMYNLAVLDQHMGRFGEAIARLEETVHRQRAIADDGGRIRSLSTLARVWLDKGELDRAALLAGAAVRIARRKGNRESILVTALVSGAMVDVAVGRPAAALELLDEGLDVATDKGLRPDEATLRGFVGEALHLAGTDPSRAHDEARRSIEIAREVGDVRVLSHCLLADGEQAFEVPGEMERARERGAEVLGLIERSPAPLLRARARILSGRVASRGGSAEEAARQLHGGLVEAEGLGVPDIELAACIALAEFHAGQGRVPRALSWMKRCAAILERGVARISDPRRQDSYLRSPRRAQAMDLLARITSGTS